MAIVQRPTEAKVNQQHQLDALNELLADLGWDEGTRVRFKAIDEDTIVLMRLPATTPPPEGWAEHFAGKLTGVFGTHEENMRYLDEERMGWREDLEEQQ
ncbi:MAG: hypothetical protein U0232_09890 [Thermomicrobiales bacterium]